MDTIHVKSAADAAKLNKYIDSGTDVFMMIYMEGCGPCNAARPEWAKLKHTLGGQYGKKQPYKFIVADVNKNFAHLIHKIKQPNSFPTIIYLSGDKIENYEDSAINDKRRDVDCFMNWIESHVSNIEVVPDYKEKHKSHSSRKRKRMRKSSHKRRTTGGRTRRKRY
jgi:hypothetical protein